MSFEQLTTGRCLACKENAELSLDLDDIKTIQDPPPRAPNEIRARPAEELLTIEEFIALALWLDSLNIDVPVDLRRSKEPFHMPLVRWMVAYVLYGGLEKGIKYTLPCGCQLAIEPETIDEIFDRRKTEHLPVDGDWSAEKTSYDTGIYFWVARAVAGDITTTPSKSRWLGRLTLLDLARQTLNSDLFNED